MDNQINNFVDVLSNAFGKRFEVEKLKTRYRVFNSNGEGNRSVYCFVDFDGNIYKPAGWKAPAKGVRGHISNPFECCEKYSIKYLR